MVAQMVKWFHFHLKTIESERKWSRSVVFNSLQPQRWQQPGSLVHGIFQARILEWVAISFSRSSQPRDRTWVSRILNFSPKLKKMEKCKREATQSCLFTTPMDCSPPGSYVHGGPPGKSSGVGCHFLLHKKGEKGPSVFSSKICLLY